MVSFRHFDKAIAGGADDLARLFDELTCTGRVAGVVIGDQVFIIGRLVDAAIKRALVHHVHDKLADVVRIGRVKHVHRAAQRGGEDSRPPGMSAFAPDDGFDTQHAGRVDDALVDFFQIGEIEEQAKVAALVAIRAGGPTDAQVVEQFGIANHRIGVGKIVR